jgi:hypothetical protein
MSRTAITRAQAHHHAECDRAIDAKPRLLYVELVYVELAIATMVATPLPTHQFRIATLA